MLLDDGQEYLEPVQRIGGRTREEFVGVTAGFIMSSVLAKDAHFAVNHELRNDVLLRTARLAKQAAPMLWDALCEPDTLELTGTNDMHSEWAVRNLASILGWWSDLACISIGDRKTNLTNAVMTSVKGATVLWTELQTEE